MASISLDHQSAGGAGDQHGAELGHVDGGAAGIVQGHGQMQIAIQQMESGLVLNDEYVRAHEETLLAGKCVGGGATSIVDSGDSAMTACAPESAARGRADERLTRSMPVPCCGAGARCVPWR